MELTWRIYIATKALPITIWVKLINKKKFAKEALDQNSKTFVIHVKALKALLELAKMTIHPSQAAQIAGLKRDDAFIGVSAKYVDKLTYFHLIWR